MVQADFREHGKRVSTIRVAVGDTGELSTRAARAVAKEYLVQISRGIHPKSNEKAAKASRVPRARIARAFVVVREVSPNQGLRCARGSFWRLLP
nr:hypothetical protein [Devosia sp.]